jgi:hypothetical protein
LVESNYFPLPSEAAEAPVLAFAVEGRSPATVLVVPGTTVLPVAPGTWAFLAAEPGMDGVAFASPVCSPADGESIVFGVAVADLLLPRLAVGLLLWADAVRGAAKIAAARIELRNIEVIICSRQ